MNPYLRKRNSVNVPTVDHTHPFTKALGKIATADAASSRAAIEASKQRSLLFILDSSMTPQRTVLRLPVGSPPYPGLTGKVLI